MQGQARPFLTAQWRHLAMLNFAVDPAIVEPYVPAGTELDYFEGRTYLSVVGFLFLHTKVRGIPVPFHRNFEEINLRLYVLRRVGDEVRRGVAFIKEIVPRRLVSLVARIFYNENYATHATRSRIELPESSEQRIGHVSYEWHFNGRWQGLRTTICGAPEVVTPGSEEAFITEHYWGYSRQKDGGTIEYQVEHPPWRVWQATAARLDCDAGKLYVPAFEPCLAAKPTSAFVADGSAVCVREGVRIA